MNEAQAIITAYGQAARDGVQSALATVVAVEGSAYRRPGARMLMTVDGKMIGSLSGGCLEGDVFERAKAVMKTGEPVVVRYDTGTNNDDIVWGLGLGCNGVVYILIESLDTVAMPPHLQVLDDCTTGRRGTSVMATVFEVQASLTPRTSVNNFGVEIGSRVLLANEKAVLELQHQQLDQLVTRDARQALKDNKSSVKVYELAEGSARVFIEVIEPPVSVVIFGAGADVAPVIDFAHLIGWHTSVVDTQAREASRARFAAADAVLLCRPEDVRAGVPLTARTMAVVMTHNYLHDFELVKTLLSGSVSYIGCLGPKRRTEQIIAEARSQGVIISDAAMRRLHFPVGLDLGAETPEEIALSIVAEMRAVLANHEGGFLKNRTAPIHGVPTGRESKGTSVVDAIESNAEETRETVTA